jgi:hypothetical protein
MGCSRLSLASLSLVVLLSMTGCGSDVPKQPDASPAAGGGTEAIANPDDALYDALTHFEGDASTPEIVVERFLSSVQSGDEDLAEQLLSDFARVELGKRGRKVAPPTHPTAQFKIEDVNYVDENRDGAQVTCLWRDTDQDGNTQVDEIIWMVRRQESGWRVAGMAFRPFEDQAPVLMNFENPDEMFQKQEMLVAEMKRRAAPEPLQARVPGKPGAKLQK